MKITLATGIYPPDLGGPATYVEHLARELAATGHDVTVVTYGSKNDERREGGDRWWTVVSVSKRGGPLLRWRRYAAALKRSAREADVVEAFSSISVGVPLWMSRLTKPKRVLRLGGDFFWERYTDSGGMESLAQWTAHSGFHRALMSVVLRTFHHIVFSTEMQRDLYALHYRNLPPTSVIENAVPAGTPVLHTKHNPLRLLFIGRFVRFKNLSALLLAITGLPGTRLTLVGDGPECERLKTLTLQMQLQQLVEFRPPVRGEARNALFAEHDLLVLPSITEISPNVALEARATGLPVLLTDMTGLSSMLQQGMTIAPMRTMQEIVEAVRDADNRYEEIAKSAASPAPDRTWEDVTADHVQLFNSLR